jgi:hypothetical protein
MRCVSGALWQWCAVSVVRCVSGTLWQWYAVAVVRCGSGALWQWFTVLLGAVEVAARRAVGGDEEEGGPGRHRLQHQNE